MRLGISGTRGRASRAAGTAAVAPVDVAVAAGPALVRDVLSRALAARPGLRVVALDADAGESSTDRLRELQPRILLIDEPVWNGESVIRRLGRASPATRILVLTRRTDQHALRRLVRAGAYGVLPDRADLATVTRAVEAASEGKECVTRLPAAETPKYSESPRTRGAALEVDGRLTKREWEVAELVATGLRNKGIALRLNITVDTVKSHLNNCFRKLKLDGRLALGVLVRSRLQSRTCGPYG